MILHDTCNLAWISMNLKKQSPLLDIFFPAFSKVILSTMGGIMLELAVTLRLVVQSIMYRARVAAPDVQESWYLFGSIHCVPWH